MTEPKMHDPMSPLLATLRNTRLMPVVTPYSVEATLGIADALIAGGVNAIEITLRTPAALDAIRAVKESGLNILLGVGTLTSAADVEQVAGMGVDFAISPGVTGDFLQAARDTGLPLLPGVATASELMLGMEYGLTEFKLFPADAINGYELLKAFAGPFGRASFCPTGGIGPANLKKYMDLPNVFCVGGSWMVPKDAVLAGEWEKVSQICRESLSLLG